MANTILVTGGLGYIGSHTVVELLHESFETVIVDNLGNSDIRIHDQIKKITGIAPTFYQVDVCDSYALQQIFLAHSPAVVIHFAAHKSVAESIHDPLKYFQNNLNSLLNVLLTMRTCGVKRLVFSSSATVYGNPSELPATEQTSRQKALSAYGSTKQMGEDIIEKTATAEGMHAIALRYFNPVGAHESGLIGELPRGIPNNLFPYIMQTASGKLSKLTVFGDKYDTKDGTCIRDYIHVVDLAKAHVRACEKLLSAQQGGSYDIYNIGTGNGISVMEVINTFRRITGVDLGYTVGAPRPGDAVEVYADASKAFTELGWKAERGIEEMIKSAWQWECYLQNL